MSDLNARAEFARQLVTRVGHQARDFRAQQGLEGLAVESKGTQDFVTVADKAAEDEIKQAIAESYPDDAFLGEETGFHPKENAGVWVTDPIDGTNNYLRGLPMWGVSLAYVENDEIKVGAIYSALSDQVFWATKNGGAYCDDAPITAQPKEDLDGALCIVGTSRKDNLDRYVRVLNGLHDAAVEHRRVGCAITGLTLTAFGQVDGYYEGRLSSWDAFAGMLIAQEVGHTVSTLPISEFLHTPGPVVVGPQIFVDLVTPLMG